MAGEMNEGRPKDARLLHLILTSLNVQSYDERVPVMLLDFAYRYTANVLQDAQIYAEHGRASGNVNAEDIRMAVLSRINHSFRGQQPKEFLLEMAAERNKKPLPPVEKQFGLRLPPDKYCLLGSTSQMD